MKLLDSLEELLIVVSLLVMVAINFGNVLSRYFIHASWAFSEELMVILFVYNSFLGASVAYKRGSHLGFTVLTDVFPPKIKNLVICFTGSVTIALLLLLTWFGMEMVKNQVMFDQRTPALGWPEWIAGVSIPLGSLLIIFRVAQSCWSQIKATKSRDDRGGMLKGEAN
ncbi:MAG: TRAP transporter small permease [Pseudomonadota bacterium]